MSKQQMETLVSAADSILASGVDEPVILNKLAARGYKAESEEDVAIIKQAAAEVQAALESGEVSPIPARYVDTRTGAFTKEASDKAAANILDLVEDDIKINLDDVEPAVKEAAALIVVSGLEVAAE